MISHDPLCGWYTSTGCFDQKEDCFECLIINRAKNDALQKVIIALQSSNLCTETYYDCSTRAVDTVKRTLEMTHDPLCPSAYTMMCECKLIAEVREEEFKNRITAAELAYKSALQDAVKAVQDEYTKDSVAIKSQTSWGVELAITAIKNIEGEQ